MAERRAEWGGIVAVGPWWLLYTGVYGPTGRHAHHAVQIISSAIDVAVGHVNDDELTAPTIIIPSDFAHAIGSSGAATMVFVDADSSAGRRLTARCDGRPIGFATATPAPGRGADQIVREILGLVGDVSVAAAPPVTPAIAGVLAELADDPDAGTVVEFAARADVSPGRFSRRFSREVGIPLRSYRRWARMLHAIEALAGGASLTVAAHNAGFTDSAHLTHTFRDYFGLAPTDLLATTRFQPLD
jgi:AraC-like DNA-binding protein